MIFSTERFNLTTERKIRTRESEARELAEPLYGTYYPSIDTKGRMAFPNKLRDILGPEFYLVPGKGDRFISVYSPEEYRKFEETLKTLPGNDGDKVRRIFHSATDKQVPDKQGRIFIKDNLLKYVEITDEVVVVGASYRAEIWSKANWDKFNASISLDDIGSVLDGLVI